MKQEPETVNKLFHVKLSKTGRLKVTPSAYLRSLPDDEKIEALVNLWGFYKEQLDQFVEAPYPFGSPGGDGIRGEASDYFRKKKELQVYLEITKRLLAHTKRVARIATH